MWMQERTIYGRLTCCAAGRVCRDAVYHVRERFAEETVIFGAS